MLEKLLENLKGLEPSRVLLQVPEGLKPKVLEFAREIEKLGHEVFISAEPCFGSCDLRDREAEKLGAVLVHIGHTDFGLKPECRVIWEEYRLEFDPKPYLEQNLDVLKRYKTLGLLSTLQYLNSLQDAKEFLESRGISCHLGIPAGGQMLGKARYPGQILGCDLTAALSIQNLVDAFLFLGTGRFHVLGLVRKTEKPVLMLDFDSGKLEDLTDERERLERIRQACIEEAKGSKHFGILVSTKPGQFRPELAVKLKKKLEELGKQVWILVFDEITPEKILGMHLDILVNTACPRLSEDLERFEKPVLEPEEVDRLFEKPQKPSYE